MRSKKIINLISIFLVFALAIYFVFLTLGDFFWINGFFAYYFVELDFPEGCDSGYASNVSQYNITWYFDNCYKVGQFINGDWWVVGPLNITNITPEFDGLHHGWDVNPTNIYQQAYDTRAYSFNSSLVHSLPIQINYSASIVKALSKDITNSSPMCTHNINHVCYLETAAVLTVLPEIPLNGGADFFRPGYFGEQKILISFDALNISLLPTVNSTENTPNATVLAYRFQRVQLDHLNNWIGRLIHPQDNMPDYGGDIAIDTGDAALRLMLNDSLEEKKPLLVNYVQMGIDWYSIFENGGSWPANGGHMSGRKLPISFLAIMLDNQTMKDKVSQAPYNTFQEDGMIYFSQKANSGDGAILFGQVDNEDLYWINLMTDGATRTGKDPYDYIDTNVPGTSYQAGINSMIWKGPVIAMQLIPEISDIWNNSHFVSYVDRWVTFGAWAQPDMCAPPEGTCAGGNNSGAFCTTASMIDVCGGWDCGRDSDGTACCNIGSDNYGITFGPDPAQPGQCILDNNSSDGIGRYPWRHGLDADTGGYQSAFMNSMWNEYRLYHCFDGMQNSDEEGIDCGGSCVYDSDGDGYLGKMCDTEDSQFDCDDINTEINKGAVEICTPSGEFDDNCDGLMHSSFYSDGDGDGVNDCEDNCPESCNGNQEDSDYDGVGEICDSENGLYENFELMTDGNYSYKHSPEGLSFELEQGAFIIESSTHWDYNSKLLRTNSAGLNQIVTKEGRNEWSNYTLSLIVGQKYTMGGIIFHSDFNGTYYRLNLRTGLVEKFVDGINTLNFSGSGGDIILPWGGANRNYTIQVFFNGSVNFIVEQVDNGEVKEYSDSEPARINGSVGFYGYDASNYFIFDEILISFENPKYGLAEECLSPQDNPSQSGSSGSGSGGGADEKSDGFLQEGKPVSAGGECEEVWTCGDWGDCQEGFETKDCVDIMLCGTVKDKPQFKRPCENSFLSRLEELDYASIFIWVLTIVILAGVLGFIILNYFSQYFKNIFVNRKF